ncbi:chorion protein S15 [Drosophila virilis]|uniref:Chorion protein S15 n=1 Tax=Drosophila virilis TaxID=7244 RepID=CH15_DROVI|nr:chorion protein S15 [Drosophila virilis]P13424.1 RecName: Full=Chorion protein S15; Flags: Precursor [Drosophila virilis]EDW69113.1 chorion protein 15 [Drosophila virilis]CAA37501.1 chorion protein s15 [Drosophila virilis]
MKFLIAFAVLALVACINANPYGSNRGYEGGRVAYVQEVGYGGGSYGNQGYGNHGYGNRGYAQPLYSRSSNPSASAAAAAASAGIRPGRYEQAAVIGYDLDASYNGHSRGGYGRGGY